MGYTRRAALVAFAAPALLLAGAYASELFGLSPCEMCWWQRWAHFAALPFAALAGIATTAAPTGAGEESARTLRKVDLFARVMAVVAALCILASAAIGVAHAGVEYGWWSGFTACTAKLPTGLTPQQLLEHMTRMPLVRCDRPQFVLLLSLAGWNAVLSTAGAVTAMYYALRRRAA